MLKQQTKLRVRLYARLSKDDGDADKESNSITNQLQMLRYNAKEKGFEVIGEYVDDGYSGTTFNRPDLNRMIKDAMGDPEPSGIMVKDMSRFGRNNAMFMYYVEEIFPNNDILFIALNDDVYTRFDENEMMPFKSIMNEYYARDTSKKIRSVKKTTALSGGFCGSFAPYGYVVDPENKRKLLVDPDTAPIVKRIFELPKQGNSIHQIARILCEDGVLIPRAYRAMKNGTLETSTGFKFPTDWVAKNVKMILENQVYLGHMVSHKTQIKSFKNKKPVAVLKEEWIIVRNTHEAIIDEETFELVQAELIDKILHGEYLDNAGIPEFEHIRENLRDLMKYIPDADRMIYDTNFDDEILNMEWEDSELENDDLKNYKAKAEYYVRQHQDNAVIAKLKTNIPLDNNDMRTLEKILWSEVGTKQDYEAEYGQKPLGEFVREIVGLDMNAAKAAFAQYLDDTCLDSRQIYFVNQIVEYIVHNGMLKDLSVLQESPFTDQGSIVDIFTDLNVWLGIRKTIEQVNANAIAA